MALLSQAGDCLTELLRITNISIVFQSYFLPEVWWFGWYLFRVQIPFDKVFGRLGMCTSVGKIVVLQNTWLCMKIEF